jgi:methylglyoxal synthase
MVKINGAKKRLKLMLHDWKRCSSLQFLKQSKDVLHNERIINSASYFTPNLINCWQTVFQVRAYF